MTRNPGGLRVLVVEDNPSDMRIVELALEESAIPFHVIGCHDLAAGLKAAKGVAVAILDLNLPDSAGLDTARAFRAKRPEVPVVVVTGTDDKELGVEALRLGVHDYIAKNRMEPHLLEQRLMSAMERARMQAAPGKGSGRVVHVPAPEGDGPQGRARALAALAGRPVVIATVAADLATVRAEATVAGIAAANSFVVAVGEAGRTGLGHDLLGPDHAWEDMVLAIERACRRLGPGVGVVIDSWPDLAGRYGRAAAEELLASLRNRFGLLGVHGVLIVADGGDAPPAPA